LDAVGRTCSMPFLVKLKSVVKTWSTVLDQIVGLDLVISSPISLDIALYLEVLEMLS